MLLYTLGLGWATVASAAPPAFVNIAIEAVVTTADSCTSGGDTWTVMDVEIHRSSLVPAPTTLRLAVPVGTTPSGDIVGFHGTPVLEPGQKILARLNYHADGQPHKHTLTSTNGALVLVDEATDDVAYLATPEGAVVLSQGGQIVTGPRDSALDQTFPLALERQADLPVDRHQRLTALSDAITWQSDAAPDVEGMLAVFDPAFPDEDPCLVPVVQEGRMAISAPCNLPLIGAVDFTANRTSVGVSVQVDVLSAAPPSEFTPSSAISTSGSTDRVDSAGLVSVQSASQSVIPLPGGATETPVVSMSITHPLLGGLRIYSARYQAVHAPAEVRVATIGDWWSAEPPPSLSSFSPRQPAPNTCGLVDTRPLSTDGVTQ